MLLQRNCLSLDHLSRFYGINVFYIEIVPYAKETIYSNLEQIKFDTNGLYSLKRICWKETFNLHFNTSDCFYLRWPNLPF